ncbi:MAG TPA: response regulator transcription factor [Syntrophorhabdaceae bacterium]|nr:response regulator transcription factor [Syntrophorhabdaceae bacterium]
MMTEDEPVVFVIDDDASVCKSLMRLLRSFGYEARAFHSAEHFLEQVPFQGTGCIILDVRMPGIGGMALQDKLGKTEDSLPVIFITGHGDIPMSVQAMKKGATDFLPKPFEDGQLIDAVVKAVEKSRQIRMSCNELNNLRMRLDRLTPREREVLPYIIAGLLNKQIAFKLNIAEKTIKVHRAHIMEKLGVGSVAELVRLAEKANIEPYDQRS